MTLPTYPVNDFDQGNQLLQQLGSFWVNVFQDNDILQAHLRSSGQVHAQNYLNYLEAVACVSRLTVPVFHRQNWYLLTALQSVSQSLAPLCGDPSLTYGESSSNADPVVYGQADSAELTLVQLPADLIDSQAVLQNMVVYPSKVWVAGIDYSLDAARRTIAFRTNPFTDPLVPKRDVIGPNGETIDVEICLWIYQGDFDLTYVYTHFGYVLGLKLQSSKGYKQILNAVWDMYVSGFSPNNLSMFLAAMSGTPTVIGPTETVQVIRQENSCQLIITDVQVYRIPLTATVTVSVGDVVYAGQTICDAVQVSELSNSNPNYSILPAISLSQSFLTGQYFGELSFKNHDVALEFLGHDLNGRTVVRFETCGFPADIETFWEFVHAQGIQDKTLANLLDKRTAPLNEPTMLNLPAMVNPLQFVLDNLLRNNLFVIKVRQNSFDKNAVGLSLFRMLRSVIPPHTTYVVFVELVLPTDVLDLSTVGGEDNAGASDTEVSLFYGNPAVVDEVWEIGSAPGGAATYGDAHVSARLLSMTCQ